MHLLFLGITNESRHLNHMWIIETTRFKGFNEIPKDLFGRISDIGLIGVN